MQVAQVTLLLLVSVMAICCHSQSNELFNSGDRPTCNSQVQYSDLTEAYNLLVRVRTGRIRARAWLLRALRNRINNLANVFRSKTMKRPKVTFVPPPPANPSSFSYNQPWTQINITTQSAGVPTFARKSVIDPVTQPITFTTSSPEIPLESASSTITARRSPPTNSFFGLTSLLRPRVVSVANTNFETNYPSAEFNSAEQVDLGEPSERGAIKQNAFAELPANFMSDDSTSSEDSVKTFPETFVTGDDHYYQNGDANDYRPFQGVVPLINRTTTDYRLAKSEVQDTVDSRLNMDNGQGYIPMY